MLDVVGIHEPGFTATGEAAAAVTSVQRSANRRGNTAGLPAHIEYIAFGVFNYRDQTGIAGQPPGSL